MSFGIFILFLLILLFGGGFLAGYAAGRRNGRVGMDKLRDIQATAWQEGYDASQALQREPAATVSLPLPTAPETFTGAGDGGVAEPVTRQHGDHAESERAVPAAVAPGAAAEPPPATQPARVLTPVQRQLRNINITLYVAVLMIVAAAGLFVGLTMPPMLKLAALYALTAAFYVGGLVTYALRKPLRPVAAAFVGTGLALLPLSAIATYAMLNASGTLVWLLFSVLGTVAVGYATVRLRSRVLAWLAVLILTSTAMAGAAVMQRGVFGYLLLLLVLSIVLLLGATMSQRIARSLFFQAVSATAQLLPLLTAALALVLLASLSSRQLLWLCVLLSAQLLLGVRLFEQHRRWRLAGARAAAVGALVAGGQVMGLAAEATACLAALALAVQAALLGVWGEGYRRLFAASRNQWRGERAVLWVLVLMALGAAYQLAAAAVPAAWVSAAAVPLLMLCAVPGLRAGARIEAVALIACALTTAPTEWLEPWRSLPSLGLGVLLLAWQARRSRSERSGQLRIACWALTLVLGVQLGRSLAGSVLPATPGVARMALVLGLWVPLFAWWVADVLRQRPGLTGRGVVDAGGKKLLPADLRTALASILAPLSLLLYGRSIVDAQPGASLMLFSPLGLQVTGLLATVVLLVATGLWMLPRVTATGRWAVPARAWVCAALAVCYALSLAIRWWSPALAVAALAMGYLMVERHRCTARGWRVAYALLAQAVFSSAVWWLVAHLHVDAHGQYAFFTVSLFIPQALRLVAARRRGMGLRTELRIITWVLLAYLSLSAMVYDRGGLPVDRGVLLLVALLLGLHGLLAYPAEGRGRSVRQFFLAAPIVSAIALAQLPAWQLPDQTGWIRSPWWPVPVALGLLLGLSAVALAGEWALRHRKDLSSARALAVYLPLIVVGLWQPAAGWVIGASLLAAAALGLMVHTRRVAWYAIGATLLLGSVSLRQVAQWRENQGDWRLQPLDVVWGMLGLALVLWLLAAGHGRFQIPAPRYPRLAYRAVHAAGAAARLYFAGALAAALVAGLLAHWLHRTPAPVLGGAALILGVAVVLRLLESPAALRPYTVDILWLLTVVLGVSSNSLLRHPPTVSVLACWLSLAVLVLVPWRLARGSQRLAHRYLLVAGIMANIVLVANLFHGNGATQIYALAFFAVLTAYGLKQGNKAYLWWGAVTITLMVLWSLRSLAFMWLILLGLGLIIAAVLQLLKVDRRGRATGAGGAVQPEVATGPENSKLTSRDTQRPGQNG